MTDPGSSPTLKQAAGQTSNDRNGEHVTAIDLTALEIATATVRGHDPNAAPLPLVPAGMTPLAALEAAVLPAVMRPPCVVTFSGGRDSSLVLAVAAKVARRQGLPLPIPVTINFVGIEAAEESSWQEMVIRHLDLEEWEHKDITTELDRLGPIARNVLKKHGVIWPLNCYVHEAVIRRATGGSLMTGMFGDSVFGGGRWVEANQVLAGRRRPELRDGLRVGLAFAPEVVRQRVFRRAVDPAPWLRPEAEEEFIRGLTAAKASAPRRWDRWIDWYAGRRSVGLSHLSMAALGAAVDSLVVQPLADPTVLATMRATAGSRGIGNRTDMMRGLFGSELPDALLARPDKAVFSAAFRGEAGRTFARNWQGDGVDTSVVDPEALKREWEKENIDSRTTLLIQSAWLNTQPAD